MCFYWKMLTVTVSPLPQSIQRAAAEAYFSYRGKGTEMTANSKCQSIRFPSQWAQQLVEIAWQHTGTVCVVTAEVMKNVFDPSVSCKMYWSRCSGCIITCPTCSIAYIWIIPMNREHCTLCVAVYLDDVFVYMCVCVCRYYTAHW